MEKLKRKMFYGTLNISFVQILKATEIIMWKRNSKITNNTNSFTKYSETI